MQTGVYHRGGSALTQEPNRAPPDGAARLPGPWKRVAVLAAAGAAAAGVTLSVGFWGLPEPAPSPATGQVPGAGQPTFVMSTPFIMPSIVQPPTLPAAEAGLEDGAVVLGVSAAGKHRAFLLKPLARMASDVGNDVVGDVPVSVTYCDTNDTARVFTSPERGAPLSLSQGGVLRGRLVHRVGSGWYMQDTGEATTSAAAPFPYTEFSALRTTWKAWREAHPDTDVYVGVGDNPPRWPAANPGGS